MNPYPKNSGGFNRIRIPAQTQKGRLATDFDRLVLRFFKSFITAKQEVNKKQCETAGKPSHKHI